VAALLAGGSSSDCRTSRPRLATTVSTPGGASGTAHCQGSDGSKISSSVVLDVAQGMGLPTSFTFRFARAAAREGPWCEVDHCLFDWAPRSLKREISRKAAREALTGVHAGRVLSRVILKNQGADAVAKGGRQHQPVRNREHGLDSARSKTPARMENPRARTGRPHQRPTRKSERAGWRRR
jgi:hypothetical protein